MAAFVRSCTPSAAGGVIYTHLNPGWVSPEVYVQFLNQCFPRSWNLKSFHWYLSRRLGGKASDIIVRTDGSRLLGMVAVCYRRVRAADGRLIEVGIMAAGGTLPSEQRRGHYSALMQACLNVAGERSCEALLGFVTRSNGSGRGLSRLGAYSIPSFYIASPPTKDVARAPQRARPCTNSIAGSRIAQLARAAAQRAAAAAAASYLQFNYMDGEDWEQQFLRRANPIRLLRPAHDSTALVESVGSVDRLQWLDCPSHRQIASIASLAEASRRSRRGFFLYTMDPLLALATRRIGLRVRGGYLKILPVHAEAHESVKFMAASPWRLQSGDRL